eukprot:1608179-Amphidinium_carterae.1
MTVAFPFKEAGIKHSMNAPLLRPSVESDSSACSLVNRPSVSALSAMRPKETSPRSAGKLKRTVHVEDIGSWIDFAQLSAFRATNPAS